MRLVNGTRLGPYEIDSLVGAGGMGEVYKARDTRLDRIVAIKVLPPVLATHPDLRERFEREARAISNVSHPNICTLFDLGSEGGTDYIVMEFLEGESLAARLERGALPFDHALSVAVDIASALETAHRRGIVHRDLKPGNVMLVRRPGLSGAPVAKLLDFGLAKLAADAPAAGESVATAAQPLTQQGTILGTFQYMSPEQLEGGDADERSDIFAFGSMFYEMLTGRRAFEGKSQASLIGAILKDQPPPVSAIQSVTPPAVDRIVARCLAKDPDERWQTASDLAAELRWAQQGGGHAATTGASNGRTAFGWREGAAWILAAVGLIAAGLSLFLGSRPSAPQGVAMRFAISEPAEAPFMGAPMAPFPAISPDGARLLLVAGRKAGSALAIHSMDSGTVQILPGTDGASLPFWSADSRSVAFQGSGKLLRYDLATATVQTIAATPGFEGGAWNRDGIILYGTASDGLFTVAAQGGRPRPVTQVNRTAGETSHRWPIFMPDGRHYVFVVSPGNTLRFGTLDSGETKDLTTTEGRAIYSAAGYLMYAVQGVLHARRFDPVRGEFEGDPSPVADHVRMLAQNARATYSVSDNGVLVYRGGSTSRLTRLQWYDRSGKPKAEVMPYDDYRSVSLSPDGTRVAFHKHDDGDGGAIWVKDLARGTVTRTTFKAHAFAEAWHPDGRRIAYARTGSALVGGPASPADVEIFMTAANGTGQEERLAGGMSANAWPEWSPDGKVLLYQLGGDSGGNGDIWALPMDTRKPVPYIHSASNEGQPSFSPDGRWVAYMSTESGRPDVYVQPYPANGEKWPISVSGGTQPRWRGDGKELFYLTPSSQLTAVDIAVKENRFHAGVPRPLFTMRTVIATGPTSPNRSYAVARDGLSFLIDELAPDEMLRSDPLTVIVNWTALLRR